MAMNLPTMHKNNGLCTVCKLSTKLPIHQHCGEKLAKPVSTRKRTFKEIECHSVDCDNIFTPTSAIQKLCPTCSDIKRTKRREARYK